ncbi:unnamed protein product [Linum tenue]|uniref:Uncharacterized protein n=1 Tax=Linum tenue TaxID=586396 RepID=A0AAV0QQD5_9ROSI|nr:unnamed protein product [Linum tenue]
MCWCIKCTMRNLNIDQHTLPVNAILYLELISQLLKMRILLRSLAVNQKTINALFITCFIPCFVQLIGFLCITTLFTFCLFTMAGFCLLYLKEDEIMVPSYCKEL